MHAHFSCRTFTLRARRLALVLAVGAVALTSASSADAASVAMSGGVLIFEADPGEQNTVEINRTSNGFARVWGGSSVDLRILTPGTCSPSPPSDVVCDLPQRVVVKTGDENDNARSIDFPAEIQLGPGDDELLSGRFADTVIGGDGRDSVSYFEFAVAGRLGGEADATEDRRARARVCADLRAAVFGRRDRAFQFRDDRRVVSGGTSAGVCWLGGVPRECV